MATLRLRVVYLILLALAVSAPAALAQPTDLPPPLPAAPSFRGETPALVVGIVDAQSVRVVRNNAFETLRLTGVAAPVFSGSAFHARESHDFLANLLEGERVWIRLRDPNEDESPPLADIYRHPDGLWVNLEVVRQGYGATAPSLARQHESTFRHFQEVARQAGKGIWNTRSEAAWREARDAATKEPAPVPAPVRLPVPSPAAPEPSRAPLTTAPPATTPPPTVTPPPTKAPAQNVTVYVTRTGSKYHRAGCRYLKSSIATSLSDAKGRYSPCSVCKPPV